MALRVAVDFGTSSTCVAVAVGGREPQVVVVDGQPLLSSAVYAGQDGTLFVGQEAERQAALDPSRFEPHPKRRVDEPELLLGDTVVPVRAAFHAVLARAVGEARRVAGGAPVDQLVLTHPADWGVRRTQVLRSAAAGLADRVVLVPEPVAAAVFHAATSPGPPERAIAVLDLGGGTVDVGVVRSRPPAHAVLATRGDPSFGGADVDQLLLEHIGAHAGHPRAWRDLVEGRDLAERRRRRVLRQDVRGAKETLSRHTYADVPLPAPFPDAHVTRDDLERLIDEPVSRAAGMVAAAVADAGLAPAELAAVFLVGGSSRIPLVARRVADRTGVVPVTLDQPETVVARGALRAVPAGPERPAPAVARAPQGTTRGAPAAAQHPAGRPSPPAGPAAQGRPLGDPWPGAAPARQAGPGDPWSGAGAPPPGGRFPTPPAGAPARSGRKRVGVLVGIGAAVLAAAVAVGVVVLLGRQDQPPADPGRVIAQYEYRFSLPDGWTQTGGDAQLLRTEIKPADATDGADLVLVQERRLSFDSSADRGRAVQKLRADYESGGDSFSGFTEPATYAGRDVVRYRERLDDRGATVDWYVLFQGTSQVSVGCQHTDGGADRVGRACEAVVRSMVVTG
ncbi:type VII secretion-associated protein [Actinokineospora bangkokensis]|uniref:Type VII secretion-associated protein n=1 Tax=Actinokineospora bangkokensis TaxID=1193682 RepID=A0A1Q9LF08_9PSEU|nr:type VII secretion-associated protein [Actinokineospora bangkokensis]OLR90603.1 type VII secretion-associated protein [Actinokineospora bangkokensis]